MSGYDGSPDHAAEQMMIFNENAVQAVLECIPKGESAEFCQDDSCGEPIPEARRKAIPGCQYCVDCAPLHEVKPKHPKMLNYIL